MVNFLVALSQVAVSLGLAPMKVACVSRAVLTPAPVVTEERSIGPTVVDPMVNLMLNNLAASASEMVNWILEATPADRLSEALLVPLASSMSWMMPVPSGPVTLGIMNRWSLEGQLAGVFTMVLSAFAVVMPFWIFSVTRLFVPPEVAPDFAASLVFCCALVEESPK